MRTNATLFCFIVILLSSNVYPNETCVICQKEITGVARIPWPECNHIFCNNCIYGHLGTHTSCLKCLQELITSVPVPEHVPYTKLANLNKEQLTVQLTGHICKITQSFDAVTLDFAVNGKKEYKDDFRAISRLLSDAMFANNDEKKVSALRKVLPKLKDLKLIVMEILPEDLECINSLIQHLQYLLNAFSKSS